MAVERKRGCGYRKIGGTYLEGEPGPGYECGRLPLPIKPCPLCDQRPAFTRGLQRITPLNLLHAATPCRAAPEHCRACPLNVAVAQETAGLLWVGGRFYTPESFTAEAVALGPSKRVPWPLPKWFEFGTTWVFLAHEEATAEECAACGGHGRPVLRQAVGGLALQVTQCETCGGTGSVSAPAVFHVFKPRRVVRIVPETMPAAERERLRAQGLTLVEVPASDPDHQPAKRNGEDEE